MEDLNCQYHRMSFGKNRRRLSDRRDSDVLAARPGGPGRGTPGWDVDRGASLKTSSSTTRFNSSPPLPS